MNAQPPVEPGKRQRSIKGVPIRVLVPNMVTLLALCAGITSIRMESSG